ncbi:MAG: hypothetical protein MK538_10385 [Planctomycetes bacterium]|nr:hypothetical protein [Planctomycetota bacterium]
MPVRLLFTVLGRALLIGTAGLTLLATSRDVIAVEAKFEPVSGQRQLFLDDVGIEKIRSLTRTLHQPIKKGPVIRPTWPVESYIQTRSVPAWDPEAGIWKIWLFPSGDYPGTAYAESKDGLHWTKPSIGQVEVNGSRDNNYITIDEKLTWPANLIINVVRDPHDPDPARRFKGLGHAHGREPMVSADGIHWKRLNVPKIDSRDESNMSYDPVKREFIATVKTRGDFGRSHAITTSKDFEHWTAPRLFFQADKRDQEICLEKIKARRANPQRQQMVADDPKRYNADVYNVGVFRYESLYIGMPVLYYATGPSEDGRNTDGFKEIQLAVSRDLVDWKRLANRQPFIPPSPIGTGAFDLTGMIAPSNAVVRGEELWFYYSSSKYRRAPPDAEPDKGAVSLAVLRRDGFMSLDADDQPGSVLTRPLQMPGSQLFVNVDAPRGKLHVEVLDQQSKVVARSKPLSGNLLRGKVEWETGDVASVSGRMINLRFTLRRGRLYSYWVE